jgi:hypothetical protein
MLYRFVLFCAVCFYALLLQSAQPLYAFHEKGVGHCDACHTMHNSEDGRPADPEFAGGEALLKKFGSPTALCLSCHATEIGAVLGLNPLAPPAEHGAGNFVFLREDNLADFPSSLPTPPIPGTCAGHSVVAPELGLYQDSRHSLSPGGNYPARDLSCTSCHDPHGNDNFRMLYGSGPVSRGSFTFSFPAPKADGIPLDGPAESPAGHTAYQHGMGDWCMNCHAGIHQDAGAFKHPVNEPMDSDIAARYNRYAGEANPDGGSFQAAYLPQVPFEDESASVSSTAGPSSSSRISCITCHRAHATSAPEAGRWDFNIRLLSDDGRFSGSYPIPSPYPDITQRSLCLKCHAVSETHDNRETCLSCHRKAVTSMQKRMMDPGIVPTK